MGQISGRPVDFLRRTCTGILTSEVFAVNEQVTFYDSEGEQHLAPEGSLLLVLDAKHARDGLVERLLDGAELGVHAGWAARIDGSAIRTEFDIRTQSARRNVGEDPIPF